MIRKGTTINDAAHEWVREFSAFPYSMIEKLYYDDPCDWEEITPPAKYDRVYVFQEERYGTIADYDEETDLYTVELDRRRDSAEEESEEERTKVFSEEDIEVERDSVLPMWGTMWQFGDSCDEYWLEELGGLRMMADCGLRIYKSEEFGYFFGIDGAGYSFYESHWIPLYKARGLKWHDEETEVKDFVMPEHRMVKLYRELLTHVVELEEDKEELIDILKDLGFTDEEIKYEGLSK